MEIIGLIGMLGICSVEDIWKRQVHVAVISIFGIIGIVLHVYYAKQSAFDLFAGMLVGIVLYIISILSGGRIGRGDALLVTSMGTYLGFWDNLTVLWMASVMAAVFGVMILIFLKKEREKRLPFVPFLLVAYLLFLTLSQMQAFV